MKLILAIKFFSFLCFSCNAIQPYLDFTEKWEGKRNKVYLCSAGHKTIGIGHKLKKGENFTYLNNAEVYRLYMGDMKIAITNAMRLVGNFKDLPLDVKLILVDMSFNLGYDGLSKFKKALAACENRDWKTMADELQNSKWYGQVGRRSKHHVKKLRSL
jgi:lysozyme